MKHTLRKMKREPIKHWILYFLLIGSLISNLCEVEKQTGHSGDFFIKFNNPIVGEMVLNQNMSSFWESYSYHLTQIKWREPLSIIASVIPYVQYNPLFASYFEANEMTFDRNSLPQVKENKVAYTYDIPKEKTQTVDLEKYKDYYYVLKNFMTGDASLGLDIDILKQWDFYELMQKPITVDENIEGPKILIFHTHAREAYIGGETVVDVGEALKTVLEEKYNLEVLHVTDEFYAPDNQGGTDGTEYEIMEPPIRAVLEEYPSIQVVIDLHRDGVNDNVHLVTEINGKKTANVMFVNGLCLHRNSEGEIIHKEGLPNPYLADNLAFSIQAQTIGRAYYPGLLRKIYCKAYRYSSHMRPNSLVVEVGAQTNTGEEALNAVEPLADILAKVLQKD